MKKTCPAIRPNRLIWSHANSFKDVALICRENNLAQPMAVNAALAIELYLKSFLAVNVLTEQSSNMRFYSGRGHVFTKLIKKIQDSDKELLFEQLKKLDESINWEASFEKFDDTFVNVRYWYESGSGKPINPEIVDLAEILGEAVLNVGKIKHS